MLMTPRLLLMILCLCFAPVYSAGPPMEGTDQIAPAMAFGRSDANSSSIVATDYVINSSEGILIGQGRLSRPENYIAGKNAHHLVLLAHGNGFDQTSYQHLQQWLAAAGYFVAVVGSVDDAEIDERRDDVLLHLDFLLQQWAGVLSRDLVLIGHSRGGEAVIHAANRLLREPMGYNRVRTLVSIAPSYEANLETPAVDASGSLLILYGTHDDDVTNEVGIGVKPFSPFRLFDHTWSNYTGKTPKHKAMVLLHGADHAAFSDRIDDEPKLRPTLSGQTQQWAARAYIELWLRWQLHGEADKAAYFTDSRPLMAENGAEPLPVSIQYDTSQKRVIDDFEDLDQKHNKLGGNVAPSRDLFLAQGPAYEFEAHSPHDSSVALIGWRGPTDLWFDMPQNNQDLRAFSALSFRVAQVYKDEWNLPAGEQDFHIAICTRSGVREIRLSDIQRLPYPTVVQDLSPDGWDYTVSAMKTIRIPLTAFGEIDLSKVTGIGFIFQKKGASNPVPGLILFDDLALHP